MSLRKQCKRIIIKIGTSTLTGGKASLSKPKMVELVRQIAELHAAGHEVVLVTSGGIAAGREKMGYPDLPKFMPGKQMLAAVGQPRLFSIYTQLFGLYGLQIAQVLLTREDLANRNRYLNARNTLEALLEFKVVPIINENDTVATEEIRFGDNDNLSALVANILESDLLLLLTDQDGVFTADPREDANAKIVRLIDSDEIPSFLRQAASGSSNGLGTGGMSTKLSAADFARRSGSEVVVANGNTDDVITRVVLQGEDLGTRFTAVGTHLENRKRYLLSGLKDASGMIQIDAGAVKALKHGGSLLPVGIKSVKGSFVRGDSVLIVDSKQRQIGVGLSNYDFGDVVNISGKQSDQINHILGFAFGAEVVHRDNLVVLSLEKDQG